MRRAPSSFWNTYAPLPGPSSTCISFGDGVCVGQERARARARAGMEVRVRDRLAPVQQAASAQKGPTSTRISGLSSNMLRMPLATRSNTASERTRNACTQRRDEPWQEALGRRADLPAHRLRPQSPRHRGPRAGACVRQRVEGADAGEQQLARCSAPAAPASGAPLAQQPQPRQPRAAARRRAEPHGRAAWGGSSARRKRLARPRPHPAHPRARGQTRAL
jgi:hypothetical protein